MLSKHAQRTHPVPYLPRKHWTTLKTVVAAHHNKAHTGGQAVKWAINDHSRPTGDETTQHYRHTKSARLLWPTPTKKLTPQPSATEHAQTD